MPNLMDFQLRITKAKWLEHPRARWNAGLVRAGMSFHNQLARSKYPEDPPLSTYVRTFTLAKKANFRIVEEGNIMEFGSTHYLPYLLIPVRNAQNWAGMKDKIIERMRGAFYRGITKWDKQNDTPEPDDSGAL